MQAEEALQLRQRIIAASGASVASALVVNPLDIVKTRIQAQVSSEAFRGTARVESASQQSLFGRFALDGCSTACPAPRADQSAASTLCRGPECAAYDSTLDGVRKIIKREGLLALWRGTDMALLMAVPMVGVYLPLYDFLNSKVASAGNYAPLIAGAASRTAAVLATAPLELLRVRMQAAVHPHQTDKLQLEQQGRLPHCPSQPARSKQASWSHGLFHSGSGNPLRHVRRFYTGTGATLARDVPFSALYWGMLEPIRHSLLPSDGAVPSKSKLLIANFVAGSLGGAAAAAITTPLDVAKTRAQLAAGGQKHPILATLRDLAADGGRRYLFAGVGPRAARAAPACAIVLTSYEILKASPWAS